jgi:hypothetical protein
MPTFRTTEQIKQGWGEFYDENWMNSPTLMLPPKENWTYQREMRMEDVNVWEVIAEPWDIGVYAAWDPYGEFYVIRTEKFYAGSTWSIVGERKFEFETYYGSGADKAVKKRMKELNIPFQTTDVWVEPEDMWLYS